MKKHGLNAVTCALLMSLAGCDGEKLIAFPDKLGTWVVGESEHRGPDPLTLDRTGRAPEFFPLDGRPAPPPLVAGWANTVHPGADPLPRDLRISHIYQGLLRFDLNDPLIRAQLEDPEKELYRARLVLYMTLLKNQAIEGVGLQRTEIRVMRRDWPVGYRLDRTDSVLALSTSPSDTVAGFHPPASVSALPGSTTSVSMDFTDVVRSWIDGSRPNHGIMLRPGYAQLAWNNAQLIYAYEPELELTFHPRR